MFGSVLRLLIPASLLLLASCTLQIRSAADQANYSGIGSGTVEIWEESVSVASCTITDGIAQPNCEQEIDPLTTVVLKPVAQPGSAFGGWTGSCDSIAADQCTVRFNRLSDALVEVIAKFRLLSCEGTNACAGNTGTVGEGSCNGQEACPGNSSPIGNKSCNFSYRWACNSNAGQIGNDSCAAYAACSNNQSSIGSHSCNQATVGLTCTSNAGAIGTGSCNGESACSNKTAAVGNNSCNAQEACTRAVGTIGDNVCNTYRSCYVPLP